jgi:hypothetical protein
MSRSPKLVVLISAAVACGWFAVLTQGKDGADVEPQVITLSYSHEAYSSQGRKDTDSGATIVTLPSENEHQAKLAISFATAPDGAHLSYQVSGFGTGGVPVQCDVSGTAASGKSFGIVTLICRFDAVPAELERIVVQPESTDK